MTEFETFVHIPGFPDYMIGTKGKVYNLKQSTWPTFSKTQNGDPTVGLMLDGVQYRRSVKVLVAEAFVEGQSAVFNTAIQLDGDKDNLRSDNIMWRPRWFAWRYTHQFDRIPDWAYAGPVYDLTNGVEFENMVHAAIATGSLINDMRMAMLHKKPLFPHETVFSFKKS